VGLVNRGWWRRNALALAAAAVLVPATAAVIGGSEWWAHNASRELFPHAVSVGETAGFGEATWGPAKAEFVSPGPRDDIPHGARVIEVEVPVEPGDEPLACASPTLQELTGEMRQWKEASISVETEYDPDRPLSCASELTDSYTVVVPFLVPADAVGPFGVDFSLGDELPGFLRLVVAP
jgi:hypothetical protein